MSRQERRSSITVIGAPFNTPFPNQSSSITIRDNDVDYMDSSDSLSSNPEQQTANIIQSDRPVTRSYTKLQNTLTSNLIQLGDQFVKSVQQNNSMNILKISLKLPPPPPQTYQKILTNEKCNNIVNLLENSMLIGKGPNSIQSLPNKMLIHLEPRLQTHDYPILIKQLNQLSVTLNFRTNSKEFFELMKILGDIENRLLHYNPSQDNSQPRDEFEVEAINIESAKIFRQYGGIEIFKRILLMSILVSEGNSKTTTTATNDIERSTSKSLSILTNNLEPTSSLRRKNKILFENDSEESISSSKKPVNIIVENTSVLKIKCKCIHILNRIVCLPKFGKLVATDLLYEHSNNKINLSRSRQSEDNRNNKNNSHYNTVLIQYLFSLLMFKESRLLSCQLIESILLHMPMLNLCQISNIRYILEKIDDDGLSSICRIFAITLSDLDMQEKKYWSQKKQLQPTSTSTSTSISSTSNQDQIDQDDSNSITQQLTVRDQNQELLLSIPSLLNRLVHLVRRKDYAIRYTGINSELEHWMRYLDEALSDNEDNQTNMIHDNNNVNMNDNLSMDLNNSLTNPRSGASENQLYQPGLLAATKLNNFVHVLYSLSLLLIGKERKRVQKSLTKLRLAGALNSLFDYLVWNCRFDYHNASAEHQQVKSPEIAVKIQFLRLVHSFCDHSDYKRVVLSRAESEEIIKYNREANVCLQVPESGLKIESRLGCTKEKIGLLSKIVQVIKQEPFSDSFRFWLTRAVESFLRGGTSYADQLFLINRGIVEDTLQNILAVNFTRPKEVLQSCFDMLGELIKFNNFGFAILDKELIDKEKYNMLMRMIHQSLVDSNMFLRAIFLSIEFFENNTETLESAIESSQTLSYFSSFDRRIDLFYKMINTINLQNLSQENISCLNTSLVLLMLANRGKKLPQYLKAIQQRSKQLMQINDIISTNSGVTTSQANSTVPSLIQQTDTMSNFKDLLVFWKGHYLQKDKDCLGLEQNSHIEFTYWNDTVDLLLNPNPKNKCSLNYYLNNESEFFENKSTRINEYRCD